MPNKAIILVGDAGSGKSTQAELIQKHLECESGKKPIYIGVGSELRNFIEESKGNMSLVHQLVSKVMEEGGLLPAALPIKIWVDKIIESYTGVESVVTDGAARKKGEMKILVQTLSFIGIKDIKIILINISEEQQLKRLLARNRSDDTKEKILERRRWYATEVLEGLDGIKDELESGLVKLVEIDGDNSEDAVFESIKSII